jgi:hypothetical protein
MKMFVLDEADEMLSVSNPPHHPYFFLGYLLTPLV